MPNPYPIWKSSEIERRRTIVATLMSRRFSPSEIQKKMSEEHTESNPNSFYCVDADGGAYSLSVIKNDMVAITRGYRRVSTQKVSDHKARQFMELDEIKRTAWNTADPELALKALNLEVRILGTAAPLTASLTDSLKNMIEAIQNAGMDVEEIVRRITREAQNVKSMHAAINLDREGKLKPGPLGLPLGTEDDDDDEEASRYADEAG